MTISEREQAGIGPLALKDPRSVEYAWQLTDKIRRYYESKSLSEQRWRETLDEAERNRIFERVPPDKPYGSMDALLQAEIGVGVKQSVEDVRSRAVVAEEENRVNPPPKNGEIGNGRRSSFRDSKATSGTDTTEYQVARIARDHPDILERMKAGEYASVEAAAIDAGIRKQYWKIPRDPDGAARALRRHFTAAQIAALIDALRTPEDEQ